MSRARRAGWARLPGPDRGARVSSSREVTIVAGPASSDTHARHVTVSGRVQGVFFRASTRREARRHDLTGWVRNTPDGRVEAHLQGPEDAVQEVESWMRAGGPQMARVDDVEAEDVDPIDTTAFQIRH